MGLYLLWLKSSSHCDSDPDTLSAPIPFGLSEPHPEYHELINFIGLDQDLVDAAAEFPSIPAIDLDPSEAIEAALGKLPPVKMREYLSAFLSEDSRETSQKLRAELRSLTPPAKKPEPPAKSTFIPFIEIEKRAEEIRQTRQKKLAQEKERECEAYLKKLSDLEEKIWQAIDKLISDKKPKSYDQAVEYLLGLRHLYEHRNQLDRFFAKIEAILKKYPTLNGLRRRIDLAGIRTADTNTQGNTRWMIGRRFLTNDPIDLSAL